MKPHPWFRPLYRRVLVFLICIAWTAFEAWFAPGSLWFYLMLAVTAWAAWDFFLSDNYRPASEEGAE